MKAIRISAVVTLVVLIILLSVPYGQVRAQTAEEQSGVLALISKLKEQVLSLQRQLDILRLNRDEMAAAVRSGTDQKLIAPEDRKVWMLLNNRNGASNMLTLDGEDVFLQPEKWAQARSTLGVYFFITNTVTNRAEEVFTDEYIRDHVIPVLEEDGVEIGLEVWGPLFAECKIKRGANAGKTLGEINRRKDLELIQRFERLGGEVTHVTMLSVLSKKVNPDLYDDCEIYETVSLESVKQRIRDIVYYTKFIRSRYPDMKMGVLGSLIRHEEWRDGSGYQLAKRFFDNAGISLDYWVLDLTYEYVDDATTEVTYDDMLNAERIIKDELGSDFVVVTASKYSRTNPADPKAAEQSFINVNKYLNKMFNVGLRPDYYYNNLYFPEPRFALPDNDPNAYTQMRQVKMIGNWLKKKGLTP